MSVRCKIGVGLLLGLCIPTVVLGPPAGRQEASERYQFRIAYATYLGGAEYEQLREVIPYADGSVLVGGQTNSSDLPVTPGVIQSKYGGERPGRGHPGIYGGDCFLARLSPGGEKLLACTYFGGCKQERNVYGMALDSKGNVVISSATRSADLPTTPGCWRPAYCGGKHDGFVAKLSPDCKRLLWCTYLGGCWPRGGITLDKQDNVYVVGGADISDFPTTPGVVRRKVQGRNATIQKLKADGSGLVWSTLLGGSVWDGNIGVQADGSGDVYVCGHTQSPDFPVTAGAPQPKHGGQSDSFVAKVSSDARRLAYSTYLGGSANEFSEHRLCLAPDGSVLVTGVTGSPDFPTTANAYQRSLKGKTDGFLTKVSADGKRFIFSTFLGGSGGEFYLMPTPDGEGNIFIVGHSSSTDFPVTTEALQAKFGGGPGDGALAILSADGSRLLYASYLGGSGDDLIRSIALGPRGEVYLVGSTSSKDFPVTSNACQRKLAGNGDAFVVKLVPEG